MRMDKISNQVNRCYLLEMIKRKILISLKKELIKKMNFKNLTKKKKKKKKKKPHDK